MKKLSGIMKLRLAVTVVFLLLVLGVAIGVYVVSVDIEANEIFAERLTWEDIEDMERINAKLPDTNFADSILEVSGYLLWIAILILSYLMYKVWNVKEIK